MSNIVDVVVADKNLATLSKSVKAAKLVSQLSKPGPYTFFAPTELAFGKLKEGEVNELLKPENHIKLTGMVNNHVVEGKTNFKDFKDGQKLRSINGHELLVKVTNGAVTINGAKVQARDMQADNGVVHALDTVVIPTN